MSHVQFSEKFGTESMVESSYFRKWSTHVSDTWGLLTLQCESPCVRHILLASNSQNITETYCDVNIEWCNNSNMGIPTSVLRCKRSSSSCSSAQWRWLCNLLRARCADDKEMLPPTFSTSMALNQWLSNCPSTCTAGLLLIAIPNQMKQTVLKELPIQTASEAD